MSFYTGFHGFPAGIPYQWPEEIADFMSSLHWLEVLISDLNSLFPIGVSFPSQRKDWC